MLFRVHRRLPFGTRLHLTGSTAALSKWSAKDAPACQWTERDVWTLDIDPLSGRQAPARFEFKFFARGPLGDAEWELAENHAVVIPFGASSTHNIIDVQWAGGGEHVIPSLSQFALNAASPPPTPAGSNHPSSTPASIKQPQASEQLSLAVARVAAVAANGSSTHEKARHMISLTFRMKYCLTEGERMYIVGSIPELGEWNKMHSPCLELVGRDIYEVRMQVLKDSVHAEFEYKYFTRRQDGTRRWEGGENRLARPFDYDRAIDTGVTDKVVWDDRWEKVRVEFSIYLPTKKNEVMHITGDMLEIGAWFKPGATPMALGPLQMLETDVKGRKWSLDVWVDPAQESFNYRYIVVNTESKFELWEREPNRRGEFDVEEPVVNSARVYKDLNFVSAMKFDAVPPNMFIGPYPQSEEDIDTMAEGGVTGVFNVQTDEDFKHRGIQWDLLMRRYDKHGMTVVRYPIRDFDRDSLRDKLWGATHALDDMLKRGLKVYIHCTAGMGRAPACAVAYLCWVKKMQLLDAVKHVKTHRTVAVPNVPVLEIALKKIY